MRHLCDYKTFCTKLVWISWRNMSSQRTSRRRVFFKSWTQDFFLFGSDEIFSFQVLILHTTFQLWSIVMEVSWCKSHSFRAVWTLVQIQTIIDLFHHIYLYLISRRMENHHQNYETLAENNSRLLDWLSQNRDLNPIE